jgi:glycosyltransferase involved in cell wall biosynthesis
MPRLLIVCEYPTLLGGERSMLATLPAVVAAGFDVQVAAPVLGPSAPLPGPLAAALRQCKIPHLPWLTHDANGERLSLEHLRDTLSQIIRDSQADLVHANSLSASRISGPVTAELGVRSIGHLRDIVNVSQQAMDDLNCHSLLLAVSNATREHHVVQGLDPTKCRVVYNGVDLTAFQPRPRTGYMHDKLSLQPSDRLIVTIGQVGLRKGTDVALAAARRVVQGDPSVHWLVVGERTSNKEESRAFESSLQSSAASPPLAGHVQFLGCRNDVWKLMPECDLLLHAARQEPLGRVLLEAGSCGLPVVATDVGGTREIFPTEQDGAILVPADDEVAIADEICELLSNERRLQILGAAGRRRAELAFDIRRTAPLLVEHYHEVLS